MHWLVREIDDHESFAGDQIVFLPYSKVRTDAEWRSTEVTAPVVNEYFRDLSMLRLSEAPDSIWTDDHFTHSVQTNMSCAFGNWDRGSIVTGGA